MIRPRSELLSTTVGDAEGPQRESLASYIARIAALNDASPAILLARKFSDTKTLSRFRYSTQTVGQHLGKTLVGFSSLTSAIVDRAEQLTHARDLVRSTTIRFAPFTTANGLLRQQFAWSPSFLAEHANGPFYPLMWAIEAVRVCPISRRPLASLCPSCRKPLTYLSGGAHVGRCYRCRSNLAAHTGSSEVDPVGMQVRDIDYELWVANEVGSLIAFKGDIVGPGFSYAAALSYWAKLFGLTPTNVPNSAGVSGPNLQTWLQGKVPRFRTTLTLCWIMRISLKQFLNCEAPVRHDGKLRPAVDQLPRRIAVSHRERIDRTKLQNRMTAILRSNRYALLPFKEICQRKLNRRATVIRQCFPEISRLFGRRFRENRALVAQLRRDQFCTSIRTVSRFLHDRGVVPNHKTLAPYLERPQRLRCIWAIRALNEVRTELGYYDLAEQLFLPIDSESC